MVAVMEGRHPEESRGISGQFTLSYEVDWEEYVRKREEWLKRVRRVLELYPAFLTVRDGLFPVELVLANTGAAPAEGLLVEVSVDGPLRIINPIEHEELVGKLDLTMPDPPRLPRATNALSDILKMGQRREAFGPLVDWDRLRAPPGPRDPMEFYWDYGSNWLTDSVSGSCGDFRHGVAKERLPLQLFLPADEDRAPVGRLRVSYSARNLPHAPDKTVPVRLKLEERTPEREIRALVMGT